jgi:tyrosyl-tRNA synthetase
MYYTLLTDLPESDFKEKIRTHPRDAKIALARHLITWLHNKEAADAAEAEFIKVFSKKEIPDDMPEITVGPGPHKIPALIVKAGLASSNSDAIRKIREGAVSLDSQKVSDIQRDYNILSPVVFKLGRKFARLMP